MNGVVCSKSPSGEEKSDSSVQWCHCDRVWNRSRLEQPSLSQMLNFTASFWLDGTYPEQLWAGLRSFTLNSGSMLKYSHPQDTETHRSALKSMYGLCCCSSPAVWNNLHLSDYIPFTYFHFCLFQVICCVVWQSNVDEKENGQPIHQAQIPVDLCFELRETVKQKWRVHLWRICRDIPFGQF